jgi:hypothetical protein
MENSPNLEKTMPPLQKILQGRIIKEFYIEKMKANKTMRGQAVSNPRRRKDKESERNTIKPLNNKNN